jgi:hypothetical protein
MIECKYILSLCDRFEDYLMPLDIHMLCQRYNGQVLKSTYAVARAMGLSDETVRRIENRALGALAHCGDLEANGQEIGPMRLAKALQQPVASLICRGLWHSASCAGYTEHQGELLIYSPLKPMELGEYERHLREERCEIEHMTAYPLGAIVGRVLLVRCFRLPMPIRHAHQWILKFERPEICPQPIPYSGTPRDFSIDPEVAQQLPPQYSYQY